MYPCLGWMHDLQVDVIYNEWAQGGIRMPDKNIKSYGTATGNPTDTNILVWESEISWTAEQPLIVSYF